MHTATDWQTYDGPTRERQTAGGDWIGRGRAGLERGRDWLDARGKVAWIMAMIAGFILFWPIGLATLFYMIWSNRMTCNSRSRSTRRDSYRNAAAPTGNAAFNSYREETLKRLEDEREAFTAFLDQLRAAKDQAEFDQFMSNRRSAGTTEHA